MARAIEPTLPSDPSAPPAPTAPPAAAALFASAFERLRARGASLGGAAIAGTVLLQLPAQLACVDAPELATGEQHDWAQYEGQRNTSMVAYTGAWWSVCTQPNTRFGCGSYEVLVKLRVRPVVGASLDWKRVGVVYRTPDDTTERTALGRYASTQGDGYEEWHVAMTVPSSQRTVLFDAWYQDGAGHTYVDDNQGELHVVNDGPAYNVVRVEPWLNTVTVDPTGVRGQISIQVADLDYDKQVALIATKDGWHTVTELGMGAAGQANRWYWVEDFPWSAGRERWQIDVDLPGGAARFEYAVVYRHGVVNGARTYEFWDNNFGANYAVDAAPPVL